VFYVFLSNLARNAITEAEAIAPVIGATPYEARLVLAVGCPAVVLRTLDRGRATDVASVLRSRGHGVHVFDDDNFVRSDTMIRVDDFTLDVDGMRRTVNGDLLPYGDVYAILRAVHESSVTSERDISSANDLTMSTNTNTSVVIKRTHPREQVAYFFRRSGERPWLLRESHTSYVGLGAERVSVAFPNFTRLLFRIREASPMAVFDDRLVRRRVPERLEAASRGGVMSSRDGVDLLAHLLAMTIASQGGSPYR
jgi:hypothetical protein